MNCVIAPISDHISNWQNWYKGLLTVSTKYMAKEMVFVTSCVLCGNMLKPVYMIKKQSFILSKSK